MTGPAGPHLPSVRKTETPGTYRVTLGDTEIGTVQRVEQWEFVRGHQRRFVLWTHNGEGDLSWETRAEAVQALTASAGTSSVVCAGDNQ